MSDCNCKDKSQCWEPCGDLGKSEQHVKLQPVTDELDKALNSALRNSAKVVGKGRLSSQESSKE